MTRTRALRIVARLALASGLFFFTTASSCDAGDRALGGVCPEGEVCDPATEDGLHFTGPRFGDGLFDSGDVKTLAIGGRQDVTVFDVDDVGQHVALELPFDAEFDAGSIAIEGQRANVISLRGTAAGEGHLRIISQDTGELFDRVPVASAAIASVEILPTFAVALDHGDETIYAPGSTGYVSLLAAEGRSLVDQDTAIKGAGIAQTDWDRFMVGDLVPGLHQLAVTSGDGTQRQLTIEVAHPDEVVVIIPETEVRRDGGGFMCFTARTAGRPMHAAWRFAVDFGTVKRHPLEGCVEIFAGSRDTVTVRAYAEETKLEIVLPVVDSSSKRTNPARASERFTNTGGDRATMR